jgi:DNA-binding NtrC family response regulator
MMGPTALLVHGDSDILGALEKSLGDALVTVDTCVGARDALSALARADFDVVVLGWKVVGMTGAQLCEKVAGNHPSLPVIVLTAGEDLEDALSAMRAGAFDFLSQPFTDADLQGAVERALRSRQSAPIVQRLPRMPSAEAGAPVDDDVIQLARHFLERRGQEALHISEGAAARLRAYAWPGGLRELEDCIAAAVLLVRDGVIEPTSLPARLHGEEGLSRAGADSLDLDAVERAHIEAVMQATDGNKARAANLLGIDRTTLYRKLKHYELDS